MLLGRPDPGDHLGPLDRSARRARRAAAPRPRRSGRPAAGVRRRLDARSPAAGGPRCRGWPSRGRRGGRRGRGSGGSPRAPSASPSGTLDDPGRRRAAPRPARPAASRSGRSPCARRSAGAGWRTAGPTSRSGRAARSASATPSANAVNSASSYSSTAVVGGPPDPRAGRRRAGRGASGRRRTAAGRRARSRAIAATRRLTDVSDAPM